MNLPVLKFENNHPSNAHELLKDIPFEFGHKRLRSRRVWMDKEEGIKFWGIVEIIEEQLPRNYFQGNNESGFTLGWIKVTTDSFIVEDKYTSWQVNDPSTL